MGLSVGIRKQVNGFVLDVSWEIGDELAVLFGRSGAGKSLTLRAIAGLETPDAGTILLQGRTLFSSSERTDLPPQQRSLGYVFQDLALFPHMTVRENILFGGHGLARQEREERAREVIRRFGLAGLERKRPGEISGGQKQRVAFARSILRRPLALLLDEPFSALDAPLRSELGLFLRDLQRELGIPVVLVTHDAGEALALADRLILYAGGSVVQCGSPEDVRSGPFAAPHAELMRRPVLQERQRERGDTLRDSSARAAFRI